MKLKNVLNKLSNEQSRYLPKEIELKVKKGVIDFCKHNGYSKPKTLETLNDVLVEWNKQPVTIGCVNHHWK